MIQRTSITIAELLNSNDEDEECASYSCFHLQHPQQNPSQQFMSGVHLKSFSTSQNSAVQQHYSSNVNSTISSSGVFQYSPPRSPSTIHNQYAASSSTPTPIPSIAPPSYDNVVATSPYQNNHNYFHQSSIVAQPHVQQQQLYGNSYTVESSSTVSTPIPFSNSSSYSSSSSLPSASNSSYFSGNGEFQNELYNLQKQHNHQQQILNDQLLASMLEEVQDDSTFDATTVLLSCEQRFNYPFFTNIKRVHQVAVVQIARQYQVLDGALVSILHS